MNEPTAQLCTVLPQSTYKLIFLYNMLQEMYEVCSLTVGDFLVVLFRFFAGSLLRAAGEGSISLGSGSFPITRGLGLLWAQVLCEHWLFQYWPSPKHGHQGVYTSAAFYGAE